MRFSRGYLSHWLGSQMSDDTTTQTPPPAQPGPADQTGAETGGEDAANLSARVEEISDAIKTLMARFGDEPPEQPIPGVVSPAPPVLSNGRFLLLVGLGALSLVAAYFVRWFDPIIAVALVITGAIIIVGVVSAAAPGSWAKFLDFTRSGIFFIVLGLGLLLFTFLWMEATHAALTFLLVVLGVAILLYGTGTQSLGNLSSDNAAVGKYNVYIAGGAGVLAFAVAFGMLQFSSQISDTFRPEVKYARLLVTADGGGIATLEDYHFEFSKEGVSIPSFRRNGRIEVLLPYRPGQFDQDMEIAYHLSCEVGSAVGNCVVDDKLVVRLSADTLKVDDAWGDFPHVKEVVAIKLVDDQAVAQQTQVAIVRQAELQNAEAVEANTQPLTEQLPTAVPGGFK